MLSPDTATASRFVRLAPAVPFDDPMAVMRHVFDVPDSQERAHWKPAPRHCEKRLSRVAIYFAAGTGGS